MNILKNIYIKPEKQDRAYLICLILSCLCAMFGYMMDYEILTDLFCGTIEDYFSRHSIITDTVIFGAYALLFSVVFSICAGAVACVPTDPLKDKPYRFRPLHKARIRAAIAGPLTFIAFGIMIGVTWDNFGLEQMSERFPNVHGLVVAGFTGVLLFLVFPFVYWCVAAILWQIFVFAPFNISLVKKIKRTFRWKEPNTWFLTLVLISLAALVVTPFVFWLLTLEPVLYFLFGLAIFGGVIRSFLRK